MDNKENKIHQTFIRIRDFGRAHADDFAANSLGKQAFTTLEGIIHETRRARGIRSVGLWPGASWDFIAQ